MTTKKEDFRLRMRSARGPLHNALLRIDHAADYDLLKEAAQARKQAKLAAKIIEIAIRKRVGR